MVKIFFIGSRLSRLDGDVDSNVRGAVPAIGAKATASQREDKASLVLTDDGWVNALSLRK